MFKLSFKQEALNDLNDIWIYTFNKWSEKQADFYYQSLKLDCLQICNFPEIGVKYEWIKENVYGFKSKKHIIFYQKLANNKIEVLRILHESVDVENFKIF